jgi:hypothetical protein
MRTDNIGQEIDRLSHKITVAHKKGEITAAQADRMIIRLSQARIVLVEGGQ